MARKFGPLFIISPLLGEASRHVPDVVQRAYPDVPWREMNDMRNMVIHEYFGVDLEIL